MITNSPGTLIRSFFEDYLVCQKGLSAATIISYSVALRLFLLFFATDCGRRFCRLPLAVFLSIPPSARTSSSGMTKLDRPP